jgi:hypothetical protein
MAQRPVTLTDIFSRHVSLEIEGFDRFYFNGWVPALTMTGPGRRVAALARVPDRLAPGAGAGRAGVLGGGAPVRGPEPDPVDGLPQG